jgi:hypothetical protein
MRRTLRRRRLPLISALAMLLAGCGANFAPYETLPRASLIDPAVSSTFVGVCYNALLTTPAEVRDAASNACGLEGAPRLVGQDHRLSCPLLMPTRATFACTAD